MAKSHIIYIVSAKLKDRYGDCTVKDKVSKIRIDANLKGFEKLSAEYHELTHQVLDKNKVKLSTVQHHKILKILEPLFIQLVKNEIRIKK